MYISSFQINGFGIFTDVHVTDLPPGISIFYGQNEAGKSTCLEFLRCMLVGYPGGKKNQSSRFKPLGGSIEGGSLTLNMVDDKHDFQQIRLSRRPGPNGLSLFDENGNPLPPGELEAIFAGVNRDMYIKIFGFSLGELENFESLSADQVRNALYAASFGGNIKSPAAAASELAAEMSKLYKVRGSKQIINLDMAELEEIRAKIRSLQEASASYDGIYRQMHSLSAEMEDLEEEKSLLEKEIRKLERKLAVRVQWDQWRAYQNRLNILEPVAGDFPENAAERLARIQENIATGSKAVAARQQKVEKLQGRLEELKPDTALINVLPQLRRLGERKSSYRQALGKLENLKSLLVRADEELKQSLARLGPDWDCQRILNTDRSLFSREGMERQAAEMNAARLDQQAALNALEHINQEVDKTSLAFREANLELEKLPEPEAILSASERDRLRADVGRLEDCNRQMPARERAFEKARLSLARAAAPLQLELDAGKSGDEVDRLASVLDNLLNRQTDALRIASQTSRMKLEADQAVEAAAAAEQNAADLQKELYDCQKESLASSGPGREILDRRWNALRALRSIASNMATEKERLRELDERIHVEKSIGQSKNIWLLSFAVILLCAAAGIFAAHWFWHLNELKLGNDLVIPLNLWAAYVPMACGVVLLAFGVPGSNSEHKRRKLELAQLESRRETSSMQLAELGSRAQQLCQTAQIDSMDNDVLDALEQNLDQEKVRLIQDQHFQESINDLKRREKQARENAARLRETAQNKNSQLQQSRKSWHEMIQSLESGFVPLPEQAEAFFARIEGCRSACDNVENARRELEDLWKDLNCLQKSIEETPAIAQRLKEAEGSIDLLTAVNQALDSCREADIIHEKRQLILAEVKNLEKKMTEDQGRQEEAVTRLENTSMRLHTANQAWSKCLENLDLGENLTPETVREAFNVMEASLAFDAKRESARQELNQAENELAALRNPLSALLRSLNRPLEDNEPEHLDWLSILDSLTLEAENASKIALDASAINEKLKEEIDALATDKASLDSDQAIENALFEQAKVTNADAFLRLAEIRNERRNLERDVSNLEASLAAAANGEDLQSFLQSFEKEDIDSQENRLAEARARLKKISEDDREKARRYGELKATADSIASTSELAELRQKEEMLLAHINEQVQVWGAYAMANALLDNAKKVFERERQPEVIRQASEIFRKITNGRWSGIGASLENASLSILPPDGEPVSPDVLSRGAQEQAYLALRMAYIRNHAEHASALPVIMDEILVNSDPERAVRTAMAFADLAAFDAGGPQQILYFTCQPFMVDILKKASPQSPVFTVANKNIARN